MDIQSLHSQFCRHKLLQNLSKRTISAHQYHLKSFLDISEISQINEVNLDTVEQWIFVGKTERNWKPKTIRNALICLSVFFDWCVARKHLTENVVKLIPRPKLPKLEVPKSLSQEQAQLLLDWAKHYRYTYGYEKNRAVAIVAMFLFTGVRLQELLNLKISDVNLSTQTVFVELGKGQKSRMIPFDDTLKKYLTPYLRERESINSNSFYFFVPLRGRTKMNPNVIRRLFLKLEKKIGFHIHPHLLRHTFATLVLKGCMHNRESRDKGIYGLSKIMGHSDISTTEIYAKVDVDDLRPVMQNHLLN